MAKLLERLGKALTITPQGLETLASRGPAYFAFPRSAYVDGAYLSAQSATYAHIYASQPNVRLVVDHIARVAADRTLRLYQRRADGTKVETSDHPAAATMREPNDWQGQKELLRSFIADFLIYDNAYLWDMGPFGEGDRRFLVRVPSYAVAVREGNRLMPTGYRILFANGTYIDLEPSEIIHFRGYSASDGRYGTSPMETLRQLIMEESARQARGVEMVRGGLVKGGIVQRPIDAPEWSPEAMERFSEDFAQRLRGVLSGRTPVLEEGMEFIEAGITPKEAEMLQQRRFSLDIVALTFGANPALFAAGEGLAEARAALEEDVVSPTLGRLAEVLTQQLVRRRYAARQHYFKFRPKRETDLGKLFDAASKGTGGSVMTQNEFREEFLELPPVEGGDQLATHPGSQSGALPPAPGQEDRGRPADDDGEAALTRDMARIKANEKALVARRESQSRRRDRHAADHAELLRTFFRRQLNSIEGKAEGFDPTDERWTRELTDDLYALANTVVSEEGEVQAKRLAGVFTPTRTRNYLKRGAEITATNVNQTTAKALAASDDPADVLTKAVETRADELAIGRATALMAFAAAEAARQNPAPAGRVKTWIGSGAANSRHTDVDGETVPIDEAFSNGLMYPGDPAGDAAEVAGCQCMLEVS